MFYGVLLLMGEVTLQGSGNRVSDPSILEPDT